jgi:hypothetical protein
MLADPQSTTKHWFLCHCTHSVSFFAHRCILSVRQHTESSVRGCMEQGFI